MALCYFTLETCVLKIKKKYMFLMLNIMIIGSNLPLCPQQRMLTLKFCCNLCHPRGISNFLEHTVCIRNNDFTDHCCRNNNCISKFCISKGSTKFGKNYLPAEITIHTVLTGNKDSTCKENYPPVQ